MSKYTTNATVTVSVNGKDAENQLAMLKAKAGSLRDEIAEIGRSGDQALKQKLKKELTATTRQIKLMETQTAAVNKAMNNLNQSRPKELQTALRTLTAQLNQLERGSAAWNEHVKKIRLVRAELNNVKSTLSEQESWITRINRRLNDWGVTIAAAVASLTGLMFSAKKAVQAFADMDSEMANTRKFTGLTAEQVEALNEEFKSMDTRSSREQLNQMAQAAGRLGKNTTESVMEFVRAADVIGVAMDELGDDAPQIIAQLAGIFNIEQQLGTERSMLAVGSAINTLSQNCAASAPNLVDFSSRLGAIASQTGMTIDEMLAFGAVLDANRVSVEQSSTAIQSVLSKMMANPADFAKKAGLAVDEFAAAIQRSSTDALLMFVEHLSQLDKLDIAAILEKLRVQDSGVIKTFNMLAGKVGDLNNQLEVSATAFAEATSATEEFNVQNNTVQAGLDKAKKKFNELAVQLGEKLMPVMSSAISSTSAIMRILNIVIDFIVQYKGALVSLTAAILAYTVAVKASNIAFKAHYAWLVLVNTAQKTLTLTSLLFEAAALRMSGSVTRARAAMVLFNRTLKASPWGIAIAAVTAIVAAIISYKKELDAVEKAHKRLSEYTAEYSAELSKEKINIDRLFGSLDAAKKGTEAYEQAKNNILSQYGQYLQGLGAEIESLKNVAGAYRAITKAAEDAAKARALASARQKEDDVYYQSVTDATKLLSEALSDGSFSYNGKSRTLTTREQERWLRTILEEGQNARSRNDFSRETKTFLNRMGVFFADDGTVRADDERFAQGIANLINANISRDAGNALINAAFGVASSNYQGMNVDDMTKAIEKLYELRKLMETTGKDGQISLNNGNKMIFESIADINGEIRIAEKHLYDLRKNAGKLPEVTVTGKESTSTNAVTSAISSSSTSASDPLADKRDQQLAKARLDYAQGLSDFHAYQAELSNIQLEYLEKRLDDSSISAKERIELEAQYWEEISKQYKEVEVMTKEEADRLHQINRDAIIDRYASGEITEESYREQSFREEIAYLERLKDVYVLNAEERAKIEAQIDEKLLTEKLRKKQEHENRLAKIEEQFFGMSQAEKDAAYQQDLNDLNIVYQSQLAAAQNNAEEKLRIEEAYQEALKALRLKYNQGTDSENPFGNIPEWMEGFAEFWNSPETQLFFEGFAKVQNAINGLFSSYSQLVQAELDIQTAAINERYDKEVEAANGNSTKIAQIEKRREAEIAKAKNDASKKQFAMQVIQAVAQTAQNIIAAVGAGMQFGAAAPYMIALLTGIATATGAVQIAAIQKQQQAAASQGYSTGGFTKPGPVDEPAGIVHAGEWVASQKLLANPTTRSLINALDYAQRTNTIGSIRMSDVRTAAPTVSPISGNSTSRPSQYSTFNELEKILTMLTVRLNQPFVTVNTVEGDYGIKKAQDEYDKLIRNKSPKR